MSEYRYITTEKLDGGRIARITMNRPDVRNAQNIGMLKELNDAFLRAESDKDARVIILAGAGPLFSSGHDVGEQGQKDYDEYAAGSSRVGTELRTMREWEFFFSYTLRWRDLRKVTISQVQGGCVGAGLMLAWCCDLIVASDDAYFADVVGVRLGMCGVEYFAHPWEFGPRKTKELLLTGDSIDADEAYRLGMVSKVFPRDVLEEETVNFARRIAKLPTATTLFIKESVNEAQENQGFINSLKATFSIHQMNHAHWAEVTGGKTIRGTPEHGISEKWEKIRPAEKSSSGYVRPEGRA